MSVYGVDFPHHLPTETLVRFSTAKADAYVNFLCSIMCKRFRLSVRGQRNINAALSNLPLYYSADERLAFGYSLDSLIRNPVVHKHGYEHLAIMVALSTTFHESYAAEVIHQMAVMTAGKDDQIPHIRQFRDQLRISLGSFTAYDFDTLVEDYIRLDPCSITPGSALIASRCRLPARDMVRGLLAIAEVTTGKQKQVTLVGGAVIGWLVAVCEWFYDLRVALYGPTGESLHKTSPKDDAQVVLVYKHDPVLEVKTDGWMPDPNASTIDDHPGYSNSAHFLPFGGRVIWNSLLPRVFGRAFYRLDHQEARSLATAIGAVARGLEATVNSATDSGLIAPQNRVNTASYGAGLVQNITAWLPELRKGQGRMERQLKLSREEAISTYHSTLKKIEALCHCDICATEGSENPSVDGYCLLVIVETIIALGLAISRMTVVTLSIYPSREGVQNLYSSQVEKRLQAKSLDPESPEWFNILYGNEWNASDSRRLVNAVALFSGRRPVKDIPDSLIAIAHEGIVAYMLQPEVSDIKPPRAGQEGLIRISTGAINFRSKIFTRMSNKPVISEDPEEGWQWEEIKFEHLSTPTYLK